MTSKDKPNYELNDYLIEALDEAGWSEEDFDTFEKRINDIELAEKFVDNILNIKHQQREVQRLENLHCMHVKFLVENFGMTENSVEQRLVQLTGLDSKSSSSTSAKFVKTGDKSAKNKVTMVTETESVSALEANYKSANIYNFVNYLKRCDVNNVADKRDSLIVPAAQASLSVALGFPEEEFMSWPPLILAKALEEAFPRSAAKQSLDWAERFQEIYFNVDARNLESTQQYSQRICTVMTESVHKETSEEVIVTSLINNLTKHDSLRSVPKANNTLQLELKKNKATTIRGYLAQTQGILKTAKNVLEEGDRWESRGSGDANKKRPSEDAKSTHSDKRPKVENTVRTPCDGCGFWLKTNAPVKDHPCPNCVGHVDRNKTGQWIGCNAQKTLKNRNQDFLNRNFHADGVALSEEIKKSMAAAKEKMYPKPDNVNGSSSSSSSSSNGRDHYGELCQFQLKNYISDDLVECQINTNDSNSLTIQVLLDTGAKHENYVSRRVATWIREQCVLSECSCHVTPQEACSRASVNLGGSLASSKSNGIVSCSLQIFNEVTNVFEKLHCLKFRVLDNDIDMIVGLPDIRKYRIVQRIPSFFIDQEESAHSFCAPAPEFDIIKSSVSSCRHHDSSSSLQSMCVPCQDFGLNELKPWWYLNQTPDTLAKLQLCVHSTTISKEEIFGEKIIDDDEIVWKEDPFISNFEKGENKVLPFEEVQVFGSQELQVRLKSLIQEFKPIFSDTLNQEPARVPPYGS